MLSTSRKGDDKERSGDECPYDGDMFGGPRKARRMKKLTSCRGDEERLSGRGGAGRRSWEAAVVNGFVVREMVAVDDRSGWV